MTPQESQALEAFLTQLVQAGAAAKDPQAAAMIQNAVARQPDAAYLLVQRAMLLDHALADANARIAALESQQAAQGNGNSRFLDPNAWGSHPASSTAAPQYPQQAPSAPPYPQQSAPQYAPQAPVQVPPAQPAQPAQAARQGGFLSGGFGGALGSIATTAAGVAGGALLFQGIENLFHRQSGSGFLGQPAIGMPNETTVVNNYYNDDRSPLDAPGVNYDPGTGGGNDSAGLLDAGLDDSDFLDDDSSYT